MDFQIQKEFFNVISQQIKNEKISHAYLIETNHFEDIDLFISQLVKLLLCPEKAVKQNCQNCRICKLIDCGHYPDLRIIDSSSSQIKKEQLLEMKESFTNQSIYNNKQIYVIKDASKLNASSSNTILKFLEEPEDNIIAILITKNRYQVLDTILSRCQVFSLKDESKTLYDQKTYDLMKTLFSKNKGFLNYRFLLELIPDRIVAKSQFSLIEDYLFSVLHKENQVLPELEYLNLNQISKMILILENYLKKMEYNLNYKLMLDHFILEIEEVTNEKYRSFN